MFGLYKDMMIFIYFLWVVFQLYDFWLLVYVIYDILKLDKLENQFIRNYFKKYSLRESQNMLILCINEFVQQFCQIY